MAAYVQSNTQEGIIARAPSGDQNFVGKEGYFALLVDAGGASSTAGKNAVAILPATSGRLCPYIVEDGGSASGASGASGTVKLRPLNPNRNMRAVASGNISGGVFVTAASDGRMMAWAAIGGSGSVSAFVLGVSEEWINDGAYGLFRPLILHNPPVIAG